MSDDFTGGDLQQASRLKGHDSDGPIRANRIRAFANYINSYVAALVVATLPIPLAQWSALPIFDSHRSILATVTPIFCFLTIASIFYFRHMLAPLLFYEQLRGHDSVSLSASLRRGRWAKVIVAVTPLALFAMFSYCAWEYYNWFDASLFRAERNLFGVMIDPTPDALQARSEAISRQALKISLATIWDSPRGVAWFVLSFVFAEAAFVWVALKEYIQDALRLEDTALFLAGRTEKPFDGSV